MDIKFYKYHGTGNDFILVDNRKNSYSLNSNQIKRLCDRNFGIGADGLILLRNDKDYDFFMEYYNSDGHESSMCGNGGRCIVQFAKDLKIISKEAEFGAIDGIHTAFIMDNGFVNLKMIDVKNIEIGDNFYYLDTGSPHYVAFRDNIKSINVLNVAREIRYNSRFNDEGTNVNFVEIIKDTIFVRTYERGVENETLSCGTGAVASAICVQIKMNVDSNKLEINTLGGLLKVEFKKNPNNEFNNIWLSGEAKFVFKGNIRV